MIDHRVLRPWMQVSLLLVLLAEPAAWGQAGGPSTVERPNPDASGRYHIGDGVSEPQMLISPELELPKKVRSNGYSWTCGVRVTVDERGLTKGARLVRSTGEDQPKENQKYVAGVDRACLATVMRARWKPAMFKGRTVEVEFGMEIKQSSF